MPGEIRTKYLNTVGLNNGTASVQKALDRAYELRTFEIEHYWKRATYFWAFQVAIFAAFGLLIGRPDGNHWSPITVALAGLGILTAVANALSARGSGFWQRNWEYHIDMLEDEIEGRLYKTVWLDREAVRFSVSGVNEYLSWYFVVFWTLVFLYVSTRYAQWPLLVNLPDCRRSVFVLAVIILVAFGVVLLCRQRSNLKGSQPNETGSPGDKTVRFSRWNGRIREGAKPPIFIRPSFIRRYAPDEFP